MIQDTFSGRVFVLGAGFSHYISGGYLPLLKQLSDKIAAEVPWIQTYGRAGQEFDLETVLTQLDLTIAAEREKQKKRYHQARRDELARAIARVLRLKGLTARQLACARRRCAPLLRPGDCILTFNWDCLLESLLWQGGAWTPSDGYGWSMSIPRSASEDGLNPLFIKILKLHGSVNFVASSYGGEHLELLPIPEGFGGPSDLDGEWLKVTPTLTLPTYVKKFGEERTLVHIWKEATEVLSVAGIVIVVGYSFPQADAMARYLFSFAGTNEPLKKVAVVARTLRECRIIQEQIREVANLARELRSGEEAVEWALFAAHKGGSYGRLAQVLVNWPCYDLSAQIAQQAAFPDHLRRLVSLNQGKGYFSPGDG